MAMAINVCVPHRFFVTPHERICQSGRLPRCLTAATREARFAFSKWLSDNKVVSESGTAVEVTEVGHELGLSALRDLKKGQQVLAVASSLWIDMDAVGTSRIGPYCKNLRPSIALALLLIHEKAASDSNWRPYIDILPESLNSPIFWSDEELAELQGTQLLGDALGYREYVETEFSKLLDQVIKPNPSVFDETVFTLDAFLWAFGILRSRTFPPLVGEKLALVPFADLVNHGPSLTDEVASWEIKSSGLFNRERVLVVRAATNFYAGEQVLMQYGAKKSNGQLALDYGFVDPQGLQNSCRTSFTLSLNIPDSDRFYEDKIDIAELNGLNSTVFFDIIQGQGPPEEMLAFLRLVALGGSDAFLLEALFRNAVWGHLSLPVSRDNEEALCQAMIEGCSSFLAGYSSTIEEDLALIGENTLRPRMMIATVVRLGEKQVLQELLIWFERHMEELDRLEYYAERRLKSLGLMDEKNSLTAWME